MSGSTPNPPIPNSYWVVPGQFAAGEYPGDRAESDARAKLRMLLEAGVTRFIDLTEEGRLIPYANLLTEEARELSVEAAYGRRPIPDGKVPRSQPVMTAILDEVDEAIAHGETVYVHCLGGVGRTGTVVGCWLVRHGHTGDKALERVVELFRGMAKAYRHPRSPETDQQDDYVRNWPEAAR